jgi:uncharacterized protein
MSAESARLTPVAPAERVELIDILRGFALLGILVVNFWGDSSESARSLDRIVSDALDILVSSSFYPLFSFLFGLGFAVQLLRARERGTGVVRLYVRRLLALFLIGTFHAVVIWNGDILVWYSILGLLLVPLHRLSDRWLLALAALPLIAGLWGPTTRGFLDRIGGERAAEAHMLREGASGQRTWALGLLPQRYELDPGATRVGSFTSSVAARWRQFQANVRSLFSRRSLLEDVPAFFFIGFVVGRRRILHEAARHRKGLRWAVAIGLVAAVAGSVVAYLIEPASQFLESLAESLSDYGATMFYIAGISLGVTFMPAVARVFRGLAPAGRIGLTNYLMQSLTMTLLFSHYGASLTQPSTAVWLLINLAFFFGVQLPFSRWWVRRYRFGPAEWVWRSLTYGSPQPMRLDL